MSVFFPSDGLDVDVAPLAAEVLHIRRLPYRNAAAKFWTALISEAAGRFALLTQIELAVSTSCRLHRHLLFPGVISEADLADLANADAHEALEDALAAMDLFGPPPPVAVRVLAGRRALHAGRLPQDCLDCDTFPYLLVWLLDWAQIPVRHWNDARVSGFIRADDRRLGRRYSVSFEVERQHLSEGLYQLTVRVFPKLTVTPP